MRGAVSGRSPGWAGCRAAGVRGEEAGAGGARPAGRAGRILGSEIRFALGHVPDRSARCPRATREAPVPRPARAPVARGARTCSRSLRGEWPRPDEAAQARAAPAAAGRPCGRPRAGGRSAQRGERAGRARGGGARPGSPRPPPVRDQGWRRRSGFRTARPALPRRPDSGWWLGGWGGGAGTPRAPPFMGGVAAFWRAVGRLSQFKWTLVCAEPTLNRVSLQNTSQRETFQSQVVTQIGFAGERGLSQASVEPGEGSPARGRSPPCQGQGLAG